jgi:phospholipid/cholesterol/gamma-HCH transport system ATP-binding protein
MAPKIQLTDIHKSFAAGRKKVLRGINIEVNEGQSLVIIGGSGSGKSVLIKTIIGLMESDKGSIKIDGEETSKVSVRKRYELMHKFGYLFQGGALFDSLPIWENVAFGLLHAEGVARDKARKIAEEKILQVGMEKSVADLFPAELSGGMQKRISLARAIATNPEIIFFDEPTTGLDPIMSDVINNLIIKCSKELNATTITITHDMKSAEKIADKMAMLYEGQIIWEGTPDKIYDSGNGYVDQFVKGKASGPIKIKLQDH